MVDELFEHFISNIHFDERKKQDGIIPYSSYSGQWFK